MSERRREDAVKAFENVLSYGPRIDFEIIPITTMAEALPSITQLYG